MTRSQRIHFACFASFLLLTSVGCGYVAIPLSHCSRDSDCNEQQVCVQGQCWTSNGGSESSPCSRDRDCKAGLQCGTQQRCVPSPGPTSRPTDGASSADAGASSVDAGPTGPDAPKATPEKPVTGTPDAGSTDQGQQPGGKTTLRSSQPSVQGCLPGSARFCQYRRFDDEPACRFSKQSCLFDGTWTACGSSTGGDTTPGREVTDWFPPGTKDVCHADMDLNCNGVKNEGCFPQPGSYQCNKGYHVFFGPPAHHIAFRNTDKYSYNDKLHLALHKGSKAGTLRLSRMHFDAKRLDTMGPRMEWVMSLPDLGTSIYTYDLSQDATLVAAATREKLIIWSLKYDENKNPSVQSYGYFSIKSITRLGFAGSTLVLYQHEYLNKKSYHNFSSWRVSVAKDGQISLTKHSQVSPESLQSGFSSGWHRLRIHPTGKWFAMASYRELLMFRIPDLRLVNRTKLEFPPDPEERSLVFHPTKNILLLAPFNYTKLLTFAWQEDAKGDLSFQEVQRYTVDNPSQLNRFGFHPETGELYATGYSSFYRWKEPAQGETSKGELLRTSTTRTAFYPSSSLVLLSGENTIRAISAKDGKEFLRWQYNNDPKDYKNRTLYNMKFFPDGQHLLLFTLQRIEIWKINAAQPENLNPLRLQTINNPFTHQQTDGPLVFSADGKSFAWANRNAIHVYKYNDKLNAFQSVSFFTQHTRNVKALAFHPTQPWLFSAGDDKELRAWSLDGSANHTVLKQTSENIVGIGFFKQDEEHFLLTTTNNGDTFGFTFSTDSSGAPALKALDGKVNVYLNTRSISRVEYGQKRHLFLQYGSSSSTKIVYHAFYVSPVQANGKRKLSQSSVRRELPSTANVAWGQYNESSRTYYGFTRDAIRVWYCPY